MKLPSLTNSTIILIFLIFLIIGVLVYDDYGISWDETYHRINGFVSLNFVRDIFSLDAYPGLEHENKAFAEAAKSYGVLFDLPMALIEKKLQINDPKDYFLLRHFFNFLVFFISNIFFYFLLNKRFSKKLSIIGLIFLILSPRIFAESFYNMKDVVFLSFFIISLYYAIDFINELSYKKAFLSGLFCALAISVRVLAIIVPFIVIFFFILSALDKNKFLKDNIYKLVIFSFSLFIFTILFWPYLWTDPLTNFITTLKSMSSYQWRGGIFYLGNYISGLNLPWHYPIVWISVSTPIIYLLLFFLGSLLIIFKIFNNFLNLSNNNQTNDLWSGNKERMDVIFFIIFYSTIFLVIKINATLYGGWRHLYFIYPCLIFLSIRGLEFISKMLAQKYLIFFILPFLLYTSIWMFNNHPYQFAYFNIFAGKNLQNNFEIDYWGVSNKSSLNFIAKNTSKKVSVYVLSSSPYQFSLPMLDERERSKIAFVSNLHDADFLVTNHYYQKGNPIEINKNLGKKFELIKEFKVDDIPINSIYKTK